MNRFRGSCAAFVVVGLLPAAACGIAMGSNGAAAKALKEFGPKDEGGDVAPNPLNGATHDVNTGDNGLNGGSGGPTTTILLIRRQGESKAEFEARKQQVAQLVQQQQAAAAAAKTTTTTTTILTTTTTTPWPKLPAPLPEPVVGPALQPFCTAATNFTNTFLSLVAARPAVPVSADTVRAVQDAFSPLTTVAPASLAQAVERIRLGVQAWATGVVGRTGDDAKSVLLQFIVRNGPDLLSVTGVCFPGSPPIVDKLGNNP